MKGKILLVVGLGIGYVLGTRAGRERYEELKAAVNKLWNDPRVQTQVDRAEDFVKEKAPELAEFMSLGGSAEAKSSASKPAATRPAATKPAATKGAAGKPATTRAAGAAKSSEKK